MNKLFFLFVFILIPSSNTFCTSFLGKGRERKSFDGNEVRKKNGNYTVPFSSAQEMKSTTAEQRKIHPVSPVSRDLLNLSALKEALPGPEDDVAAAEQALLDAQAQEAAAQQDRHLHQLPRVNAADGLLGLNAPDQKPEYLEAKRKKLEKQRARLAQLRNNQCLPAPRVLFGHFQ